MFVSGTDWFLLRGRSSDAPKGASSRCSACSVPPSAHPCPAGTSKAAAAQSPSAPSFLEGRETVYVFNVGSKDVTLIDVANRQVRETRPLGASVRWLSNEQTYWDGARIWTYDFPNDQVQAIAIDPRQVAVTKTIAGLGKGPATVWSCCPTRRRPRSTWRATTSSRSSTSSTAAWTPRSRPEHFPETST